MKKGIRYVLAAVLALLGFSSCASLHEAQERRSQREREAFDAQQRALVEQELQRMLDEDALKSALEQEQRDSIIARNRREEGRIKLLYGVPNVPYREIEK